MYFNLGGGRVEGLIYFNLDGGDVKNDPVFDPHISFLK